MLVALSAIASAATARAVTHLLNYSATHPDATLRFTSSDMTLHIDSDVSYQSESKSRSRARGYFFMSTTDLADPQAPPPPINGAVHVPSTILDVVVSSAAKAELVALFNNAKDGAWLRTTLVEAFGYLQPATPIQTENGCAAGICNDTVNQRRSKAMEMRFYWVRDRTRQGHFRFHWRPGTENLGNYFTKHHAPAPSPPPKEPARVPSDQTAVLGTGQMLENEYLKRNMN
jgi:hypothetical protein